MLPFSSKTAIRVLGFSVLGSCGKGSDFAWALLTHRPAWCVWLAPMSLMERILLNVILVEK